MTPLVCALAWDKVPGSVSTQGSLQVCLSWCPKPSTRSQISGQKISKITEEVLEECREKKVFFFSGTGMTGRPGDRTMEMNGRSTASYLVQTPRVPVFVFILIGLEANGLLAFQGRRGIISVVRWNLRPVIFGVVL